MRGINSVVAFGAFGLLAIALAWYLNGQTGWCSDRGKLCNAIATDSSHLVGVLALGLFGLVLTMLVANGLFRLLRYRRSEG